MKIDHRGVTTEDGCFFPYTTLPRGDSNLLRTNAGREFVTVELIECKGPLPTGYWKALRWYRDTGRVREIYPNPFGITPRLAECDIWFGNDTVKIADRKEAERFMRERITLDYRTERDVED